MITEFQRLVWLAGILKGVQDTIDYRNIVAPVVKERL